MLAQVEQDVRRRHLLRRRVLRAIGHVELAGPRDERFAVRVELAAGALLDVGDAQLREHALLLEPHSRRVLRLLGQVRRLGLRGERLLHDHARDELGDAALAVGEARPHLRRELQQLGLVLAAVQLDRAVLDQHGIGGPALPERHRRRGEQQARREDARMHG